MTENNQCFQEPADGPALYFNFASQIRQPAVSLFINLSQSDYVSLKPNNFHTGEKCERTETKILFLMPCLFNTVLLPHLWRAPFLAGYK